MGITSPATTPQQYADFIHRLRDEVPRPRVFPWSLDATEALVGNGRATSYVERSVVRRETGNELPLPSGAKLTTKIAKIKDDGHSEISHTLEFPANTARTVHDKVIPPEIIVSSHRNQIIENPNPINP
jgi:hypothetical protein